MLHGRNRLLGAVLALALIPCTMATAQVASTTPLPVGWRAVAWPNPTLAGSATLAANVRYPAASSGQDAPVLPMPRGWPVIVFMHGYSFVGSDYTAIGDAWAAAGYVVVLGDTAQFDYILQEQDARAMFDAIIAAESDPTGPFFGAMDTNRMALAGHSMGGANVAHVLQSNPGYRCGFSLAPVMPLGISASTIDVPLGIATGLGDFITPPAAHSQPYYDAVTTASRLKFYWLMDATCDHMNLAGLGSLTAPSLARTISLGLGFFGHVLATDVTGLEQVFGPGSLLDPQLSLLQREVTVPQLWLADTLRVGTTTRTSQAAEFGIAAVVAAMSLAPPTPTPFGPLLLDPGSTFIAALGLTGVDGRADIDISLPPDPLLVGLPVALQGLGPAQGLDLVLGSALFVTVQP